MHLWLLRSFNCIGTLKPLHFTWALLLCCSQVFHPCGLQDGFLTAGWLCRLWAGWCSACHPTAWQFVHNIACGSPVKNQSTTAHLFYYLVKPEYFIATDKAPGRSLHAKLLGVSGSSSPASPLSQLRKWWGQSSLGWALWDSCPGSAKRIFSSAVSWVHLGSRQGWSSPAFLCK